MRINNPKLFNGDLLASYNKLAQLLGVTYDPSGGGKFKGKFDGIYLPVISGLVSGAVDPDGAFIKIYADTITLGETETLSGITILDKFNAQQAAIDAVKQYTVISDSNGIDVTTTSATVEGIVTDTIKVALELDSTGLLTETEAGLAIDQAALSSKFELTSVTPTDATSPFASVYTLKYAENEIGTINIPKDQFLSGAAYIPSSETLQFTFAINEKDEDGNLTTTPEIVEIPVSGLVDEYSAGNGIDISDVIDGKNVISIKINNAEDNKFIALDTNGFGLSGITTAINSVDYSQIIKLTDTLATTEGITAYLATQGKTVVDKDTLFVDSQGQTAVVLSGTATVIDISQEYISDAADMSENPEKLMTVNAISSFVDGKVAETVSTVNTKAVEMLETEVTFGSTTPANVPGRVIAVYDANGAQCYPTISYAAGVSTLSTSIDDTEYTVIYAKRIGQANGALPEY